jgi:hypothetical protein
VAYGVAWPIPPSADGPRLVPGWSAAEDEAGALNMTIPAYLEWQATDQGQWWLPRLRIKWAIRAEAERQDAEDRTAGRDEAAWQARGYRGGHCDPHEFSLFDDEAA